MTQDKKNLTFSKWDYIILALAVTSLISSCIINSNKKYFWYDELACYYLLADQSFTHMWGAFSDAINRTPPLYFLLGWLWARVFGSTELSLRLFSSLDICTALAIVWITLRRTYDSWSTSIGVLSVFCVSILILPQNVEVRMYALFVTVCSLGLMQYDSINRGSKTTRWMLFSNICIHAAIVNAHLFGILYSGVIVLSFIARDKYFGVFRPKVYLSVVLGWLSLVPYIPAFVKQSEVGNFRDWLVLPGISDLISGITFYEFSIEKLTILNLLRIAILLVLIFIPGWQFFIRALDKTLPFPKVEQERQKFYSETSLLIFAYAFLAVPVFVWIISYVVRPLFLPRYIIPSVIGGPILLTYLASRFISNPIPDTGIFKTLRIDIFSRAIRRSFFLITLIAIFLVRPIWYAKSYHMPHFPGLNDYKYGYGELPVAVADGLDFLPRFYYSSERDKYFFILDWPVAAETTTAAVEAGVYKNLEALKRNYLAFKKQVIETEEFLKKYNRFLLLKRKSDTEKSTSESFGSKWLARRILSNSHYKVIHLGDIDVGEFNGGGDFDGRELLLVEMPN